MIGFAKKYLGLRMEQVVTNKAQSSEGDEAASTIASFTSDDGQFCAEGAPRFAEGTLALKKAGVQGALFSGSYTHGKSCLKRGFALLGGVDSCHLGLTTYFKDKPGYHKFMQAEVTALKNFRAQNKLPEGRTNLIAACMCHPDSTIMAHVVNQCAELAHETGAWVHTDPQTGTGLVCSEGPLRDATFSLAALKSTASLPMHLNDSVAVKSCAALGFPVQHSLNDHCFSKMSVWTSEPADKDQGLKEFQAVQEKLLSGGFNSWAQGKGVHSSMLNSVPGCHCPADSEVAQHLGGICSDPNARSPIRDWEWTA